MTTNQATTSDVPNSRARTVTTLLMIMLAIMIVMDIFARRREAAVQSLPNVTLWGP